MPVTTDLKRYSADKGPRKLGPADGRFVELPTPGVRLMAWTEEIGRGFALVEHPIAPKTLAAAGPQALEGGRVQLRARGPDGRAARR